MNDDVEVRKGAWNRLDDLVSVVNKVMRPSSSEGFRMQDEFPHLLGKDNVENLYYVENNGKPASVVAIKLWNGFLDDQRISIASLGSVSTLPEFRGNGYATIILNRAFKDLRKKDVSLLLISGTRNLYKRLQCVETGAVYYYKLEFEKLNGIRPSEKYEVRKVIDRNSATDWTLDLYKKEPFRFDRDTETMEILLNATWFRREEWPMELFEISQEEKPIAYFVGYKKGEDNSTLEVMEMAGERGAIINSLPIIMDEMKATIINLRVHPSDSVTNSILRARGFVPFSAPAQGTVRVINPKRLLHEMQGWLEHHGWNCDSNFENRKDRLVCDSRNKHLTATNPGEITKCLFGTGDDSVNMPLLITDDLNYI